MINIYGKGDHAKVVSSSIRLQQFKFWDDSDYDPKSRGLWVIGIGNNKIRKKIAEEALKGKSGLVGLDDDFDKNLRLIEFERIKGGKPFNTQSEWYHNMLLEIGQK